MWPLLVAALAAGVYANAVGNDFALDDVPLVREDPRVQSLARLPELVTEPYWGPGSTAGLYRPLTSVSYALNRALTGPGASGFHAGNVLLHALVCVLVWFTARRAGTVYGTALAAALLFAAHPIHTEAVANVAGRAELLAAGLALGAWLAHRNGRLVGAGVLFALAMLSKESAVLAPLLFLADDAQRRRSGERTPSLLRAGGVHAGALAVVLAMRVAVLGGIGGAEDAIRLDNPAAFAAVPVRWATALWVHARALLLVLWPARLSSDYSLDAIPLVTSPADPGLWAGAASVAVVVVCVAVGWRRSRPVFLGALSWLVFVLPASNLLFPTGTLLGERLLYLPSWGICLLAGHALAWAWTRRAARVAVAGGTTVILVALAARTLARNPDWRDNATLALHDVAVQPRSAKLHAGAGIVLQGRGEHARARAHYERALALYPDYAQVHHNLGVLLEAEGDAAGATHHLQEAIRLAPDNPRPYKTLAPLLESSGRVDEALEAYARGTAADPPDLPLRFNHGRALAAAGRREEARRVLGALATADTSGVPGTLARALMAEIEGDAAAAAAAYRRVMEDARAPRGIRAWAEAGLGRVSGQRPATSGSQRSSSAIEPTRGASTSG